MDCLVRCASFCSRPSLFSLDLFVRAVWLRFGVHNVIISKIATIHRSTLVLRPTSSKSS
ncbi:hypothetical protein M413DRAFT_281447 [Hebeloma cylindrosporum]|uniref:Uncharacterized protein n=1 Tax=Hebeloma cylindrosporum TaxID=76867 RepID=A0A0C3C0C6_HEBCY|nr:hypothetical protein M413DRAFT_281447 [Hebeloma cylindrosporum h7]